MVWCVFPPWSCFFFSYLEKHYFNSYERFVLGFETRVNWNEMGFPKLFIFIVVDRIFFLIQVSINTWASMWFLFVTSSLGTMLHRLILSSWALEELRICKVVIYKVVKIFEAFYVFDICIDFLNKDMSKHKLKIKLLVFN